ANRVGIREQQGLLELLVHWLSSLMKSRRRLEAENLLLRHQVSVAVRDTRSYVQLRASASMSPGRSSVDLLGGEKAPQVGVISAEWSSPDIGATRLRKGPERRPI